MNAKVLLDRERPKVKLGEVKRVLRRAGIESSDGKADFGVVVGGDGVFSTYGRSERVPLLFVGVRSDRATGSKALLAEAYFDELEDSLRRMAKGQYGIVEHRKLEVLKNRKKLGEVFTDVYLQRGDESNSLRYRVEVSGMGVALKESAIGDGVVVCTRAGSTGYFSYPDKVRMGDWLEPDRNTVFGENEVGVCHIVPTYTLRDGITEHPLRYTVPWGSRIKIRLVRPADARLYGVTRERGGVKIGAADVITVAPSQSTTRVIKLAPQLKGETDATTGSGLHRTSQG
jgi:hypothetical protein